MSGGVLEWTNRPVLKTGVVQATVGSNPTPSANCAPPSTAYLSTMAPKNHFHQQDVQNGSSSKAAGTLARGAYTKVREYDKGLRTPLAAFFNILLEKRVGFERGILKGVCPLHGLTEASRRHEGAGPLVGAFLGQAISTDCAPFFQVEVGAEGMR